MGHEHVLGESGIADPVAHFRAVVDSMNAERKAPVEASKAREIGPMPPSVVMGSVGSRRMRYRGPSPVPPP